jgi:outer membrane immunogenic protein
MKLKLAFAALLASTAIASAADLPARTYTKAPAPAYAPVYNWTGFYIGVMGGYGWSQDATVGITGVGVVTGATDEIKGGFGGGTIGYNFQNGPNWVFGLEVDVAGGSISYSESALPLYSFDTEIQALGSRLHLGSGHALLQGRLCLG